MEPVRGRPVPDEERVEPRVRDDRDLEQGPPVDEDEELQAAPALGVVDPENPDPPEPGEPA
jgi:hypothetical protein